MKQVKAVISFCAQTMTWEAARQSFLSLSCPPHPHCPYPHMFKLSFIPDAVLEMLSNSFSTNNGTAVLTPIQTNNVKGSLWL